MNFEYSEDQLVFKDSVTKYLQDQYDFEKRQATVTSDKAFDQTVWGANGRIGLVVYAF